MQEMGTFQYVMIALTVVGILITSGGVVGACVWAVAKIKADITEKISEERTRVDMMFEAERENTSRDMRGFALEFAAEQKSQDHNTGEMGAALRRHIENVEREMHKIEIWGRDNYALKDDVNQSISTVRDDIKAMRSDIKSDFRDLNTKIDQKA
jgi:hypothetical protein